MQRILTCLLPGSCALILLTACSYGVPNLAPILNHSAERSEVTVLKAGFETAASYHELHPFHEDSDDDRMEYVSWQPHVSRLGVRNGFLFGVYFNSFFFFPGIIVGGRGEDFYAAASVEVHILDQGKFSIHHPRVGLQTGYRFQPWLLATYDLFHLTYTDSFSTAYGWDSWHEEEYLGSRLSLTLGKGIFVNPSLVYVHGGNRFGWGLAGVVSY